VHVLRHLLARRVSPQIYFLPSLLTRQEGEKKTNQNEGFLKMV